jgi:RNA-directed DNA polymerase
MRQVARRVSDGMILKLIKAWLRAPILEKGEGGGRRLKANPCGTPQGGVISPLLANIYLHPLDEGVNECRQTPRMVRYADDLVILCRPGEGEAMKERLARWLQSRGLALNEQKTQVVQSRASGFEFLGFSFRWQQSRKGKPYVHIEPSPAAEQALRDKMHELTRRETGWRDPAEVVQEMNPVIRGWGNYFALAHYRQSFRQMNHYVGHRLRQWLWRKHGSPEGKYERWTDRILRTTYQLHVLPS